jgi:hypothetical protein
MAREMTKIHEEVAFYSLLFTRFILFIECLRIWIVMLIVETRTEVASF